MTRAEYLRGPTIFTTKALRHEGPNPDISPLEQKVSEVPAVNR
jgi:hypothetical protein